MKLALILVLALQASDCGRAEAAKPAPKPPETGRQAMTVDGRRVGALERQSDGTYLLRYSNGTADRVSVNEVILMPEGK